MDQVYNLLVPNIYVPEPSVMDEVIKQVDLNGALNHIPRLWSDMIIFDHTTRQNLIETIVNTMFDNQADQESELTKSFANVAWDIHSRILEQNESRARKVE